MERGVKENGVAVTVGFLMELAEARVKADMLDRIIRERRYMGVNGEELALLSKVLGLEESRENV